MSFLAKITYYNKKDYHFSFFYLQICFNVSILLVNERYFKPCLRLIHYLCAVEIAKRCGLTSFHFRTRSATTVRIDETSVHTIFMPIKW